MLDSRRSLHIRWIPRVSPFSLWKFHAVAYILPHIWTMHLHFCRYPFRCIFARAFTQTCRDPAWHSNTSRLPVSFATARISLLDRWDSLKVLASRTRKTAGFFYRFLDGITRQTAVAARLQRKEMILSARYSSINYLECTMSYWR